MSTGFMWDDRFLWWDQGHAAAFMPVDKWIEPGMEHAENPAMKVRLKNLLSVSGLLDQMTRVPAREASVAEITRFHTLDYVNRMKAMSEAGGGDTGELTPFWGDGYAVAALAVGGVLNAVDMIMSGKIDNAYAMTRPSGHHAEADRGRGNCMFGYAALVGKHLQSVYGMSRVAVVDWDVHHGNGTQGAFYDDPRVLTISLHQDRYYPQDQGFIEETGDGAGLGTNINIPLPPGTGPGGYLAAWDEVVLPALRSFKPEFIVNVAGFDGSALDPIGRQMLVAENYGTFTKTLMDVAQEVGHGRLLVINEGGYSAAYAPFCGVKVVEALLGVTSEVGDPFHEFISGWGGMDLQSHQREVVDAVKAQLPLLEAAVQARRDA